MTRDNTGYPYGTGYIDALETEMMRVMRWIMDFVLFLGGLILLPYVFVLRAIRGEIDREKLQEVPKMFAVSLRDVVLLACFFSGIAGGFFLLVSTVGRIGFAAGSVPGRAIPILWRAYPILAAFTAVLLSLRFGRCRKPGGSWIATIVGIAGRSIVWPWTWYELDCLNERYPKGMGFNFSVSVVEAFSYRIDAKNRPEPPDGGNCR